MFRNVQELLVVLVGCVHLAGCMAPTAVCPLVTLEEPFLICSACLSRHTASLMHSQWYINDEHRPFTVLVNESLYETGERDVCRTDEGASLPTNVKVLGFQKFGIFVEFRRLNL